MFFFFSSRRRHTRSLCDWSSDVCSSDLSVNSRTRLMMFRGPWDAREWTNYHPDAERLFTDWANGLNSYVATHADNLPVEFKLTGVTPQPWTAKTVALRWAQLGIDSTSGHVINEIQ